MTHQTKESNVDKVQSRNVQYRKLKKASDTDAHSLTILLARRFLADFPDWGVVWQFLGVALIDLGRYKEAKHALTKAIEFCPSGYLWKPYCAMGDLFRFAGDYKQATVWYQKTIDCFPNDSIGYVYLGGILPKQGRLHEAEEVHRAGVQCSEGCHDEAILNLGLILRAQEKYAEAADCFREAISLDPKYRVAKKALRDVTACLRELDRVKRDASSRDSQ